MTGEKFLEGAGQGSIDASSHTTVNTCTLMESIIMIIEFFIGEVSKRASAILPREHCQFKLEVFMRIKITYWNWHNCFPHVCEVC